MGRKADTAERKRRLGDVGYEVLLTVVGLAATSLRPGIRNAEFVARALDRHRDHVRALARLEEAGAVERNRADGVVRLTRLGHLRLHGGRDPASEWERPWDGRFRVITFDVPRARRRERHELWRWLRRNRFGNLQGSVWISPDPLPEVSDLARELQLDPGDFFLFTAEPEPGQPPAQLAARAWDFTPVNKAWTAYLKSAPSIHRRLIGKPRQRPDIDDARQWIAEERRLWNAALALDPLLPAPLHPPDYKGPSAWDLHRTILEAAASLLISPAA